MATPDLDALAADLLATLRPFAEEIERVALTGGAAAGRLSAQSAVLYDALVIDDAAGRDVADLLAHVSRDDLEDLLDALLEHGHELGALWAADAPRGASTVARLALLISRLAVGAARCIGDDTENGMRLGRMADRCASAAFVLRATRRAGER